jgi:hypothetical protein
MYDADNNLLYVGCSSRPDGRMSQHKVRTPWFGQVADIRKEWYDTREDALRAESAAIYTESPIHNVNGARRRPPVGGSYAERAAQTIRHAIGEAGMPLTRICELSGLPYATLHRHLNTTPDRLDVATVEAIARVIGVQPEDIMRQVPA